MESMKRIKIIKINYYRWLMMGIIVLAAILRLAFITQSPPSLYWEEAALGYDAYSILQTGKDFHDHPWPIVAFESFGDWKPSGYFYALIPFIKLFGLSELAVRLPSAVAGIITVWFVSLIVIELTNKEHKGLWAAFMLAIMPWHIQFSRAGFEVNLATMWLTLGIYWLLKAREKPRYLFGAVVAMGASMYTYHALRVLAPLMSILMIIIYRKKYFQTKYWWLSLLVAIAISIPIAMSWATPMIQQRINETSLFSTSQAVIMTNAERVADGNTWWSHLIHHRYIYWGKEILAGMVSHVNPQFLFLDGDGNNRHQSGYIALLFPWMIIPILVGLRRTLKLKYRQVGLITIGWIILASIPVALTNLTPHTLRFLPAAPAVAIIMGLGMGEIWQFLAQYRYKQILVGLTIAIITIWLGAYSYDLWWVYPKRVSQDWQYGYKQVVQLIKPYADAGRLIQFTREYGRPSMYVMFYMKLDPYKIQQQAAINPKDQGELLAFDNFTFNDAPPRAGSVVVSAKPLDSGKLIKAISFLDKTEAFYVYDFN
jgi:4-amino-4-deoxy-L-arabinose transferase-like glycosyltransferase